jgi:hypothetical protein
MQLLCAFADRSTLPLGGGGCEESGHLKSCNKWGKKRLNPSERQSPAAGTVGHTDGRPYGTRTQRAFAHEATVAYFNACAWQHCGRNPIQ